MLPVHSISAFLAVWIESFKKDPAFFEIKNTVEVLDVVHGDFVYISNNKTLFHTRFFPFAFDITNADPTFQLKRSKFLIRNIFYCYSFQVMFNLLFDGIKATFIVAESRCNFIKYSVAQVRN